MAAPVSNQDLLSRTLTNTDDVVLNTYTGVFLSIAADGGMVLGTDANAGEFAGVVEEFGHDTSTGQPVANIPVGQTARVRRRGATRMRATNVACVRGTKAYVLKADGRVTNTANAGANPEIGKFVLGTSGVSDEIAVVDLN